MLLRLCPSLLGKVLPYLVSKVFRRKMYFLPALTCPIPRR